MRAEEISELIERGLPGASVEVRGADGVHFEARVVCAAFSGKRPIERHRMVHAALGAVLGAELHALSLVTLAPGEAREA